jgi:hypothetical protein
MSKRSCESKEKKTKKKRKAPMVGTHTHTHTHTNTHLTHTQRTQIRSGHLRFPPTQKPNIPSRASWRTSSPASGQELTWLRTSTNIGSPLVLLLLFTCSGWPIGFIWGQGKSHTKPVTFGTVGSTTSVGTPPYHKRTWKTA